MLVFGTDGVRGDARNELTDDLVEALGWAATQVLGAGRFAVGRDPRASGPGLAAAVARGAASAGAAPVDLGVVPTPVVARWCDDEQAPGAMVSASHNPWHDNGVKLFAPGGRKLSDAAQDQIEQLLSARGERRPSDAARGQAGRGPSDAARGQAGRGPSDAARGQAGRRPSEPGVGGVAAAGGDPRYGEQALRRHADAVIASLEGRGLAGLSIVVDGANGAASECAPSCLRRLGAEVRTIHTEPDGYNINEACGSLHPEGLQAAVVAAGVDGGIAFDGDADRVLAVDHAGTLIDGDQILAICAIDRARRGRLPGDAVVVTVMANLGLRQAMVAHGIAVVDTAVGDRQVLSTLEERGLVLGGEQSGHLIFRDLATTGDGLLTAVQLLDVVKRSGRPLADVAAAAMTRMPQVLVGVPIPHAGRRLGLDGVLGLIAAAAAARLGEQGRVLVRPSGTEPVIRVMVEAADEAAARAEAERVSAAVTEALS